MEFWCTTDCVYTKFFNKSSMSLQRFTKDNDDHMLSIKCGTNLAHTYYYAIHSIVIQSTYLSILSWNSFRYLYHVQNTLSADHMTYDQSDYRKHITWL